MTEVGAYQAKTHLPELLNRVAQGEQFVITRHGVAVAKLVPAEEKPRKDIRRLIAEIIEFRKGQTLGGLSVRELIEEGRP
ncbi:MAG: type II toxin-antitoxin system prevent-host-death family antitoxin [Thermoguttaceae bacterium]|jgi:prevent-host-death family protein